MHLIPLTSPADIAMVKSALDKGLSATPETIDFPSAPAWGKITLSYNASRLIALYFPRREFLRELFGKEDPNV